MPYIYALTETNADTTNFVTFHQPLQPAQRKKLQEYLERAKTDAKNDTSPADVKTLKTINDALRLFEAKTGIEGHITASPVFDNISF